MNSIRTKLMIVLLLIALVPLAALGIINYSQTTRVFNESIQDSLLTIVQTKNDRLEQYIEDTEKIGQSISETDILKQYISYPRDASNPEAVTAFSALEKQIENILYSFQEANWGKYHHIFLIDNTKRIAISPNHGAAERGSPSSHVGEDTSGNLWANRAFKQGKTIVSDYSSWVESDHTHQMLFFPVKDTAGVTQAVIGFELQIPYEQALLQENFKLGETGKVFLTTTLGVPIVYQGIESQTALQTSGIAEVRNTGLSSGRRANAEGVDVIDLYLANDTYPWILVAEVEASEAFKSLNAIQTTLIIGLILTLFLVGIISLFFTNLIINPITRLTKQMEEISLGNLNIKIDSLQRKDEIGKLAQAFNRMVQGIKMMMRQNTGRK